MMYDVCCIVWIGRKRMGMDRAVLRGAFCPLNNYPGFSSKYIYENLSSQSSSKT